MTFSTIFPADITLNCRGSYISGLTNFAHSLRLTGAICIQKYWPMSIMSTIY